MSATGRLTEAMQHLERGGNREATRLCCEALALEPANTEALHMLGVLSLQRGELAAGIDLLRRSLEGNPNQPHALCNLGNAFRDLRQPDHALPCYRRALSLMPRLSSALYGEGNALLDLRRPEEALTSFERAVALSPDYAAAHNNRGIALLALGRTEQALAAFTSVLQLHPDHALALQNAAAVLKRLGRSSEALNLYDRLLDSHADDAALLCERGELHLRLANHMAAIADFSEALRLSPALGDALCGRGLALTALARHEEALESLDAVLAGRPEFAPAVQARARALRALGRNEAALADFNQLALLRPADADVLYERAVLLRELHRAEEAAEAFAAVLEIAPQYDYALGNLVQARLQCCDWRDYDGLTEQLEQGVLAGARVCTPAPFLAVAPSAAAQLSCARTFVADRHGVARQDLWAGARYQHERLRIAYVSADFRVHPVTALLVGVLEHHDRSRFEIIGVALRSSDDSGLAERVRRTFDQYIDASGRTDAQIAALIRELEVDVVVDLMGYSGHGRAGLFTGRMAPVQIGFLGYPGATALPAMDYIIADRCVIPPDEQLCYTEKVIYLPDCYLPGDDRRAESLVMPTRAACGLPESGFVFCCFNQHYKITPQVFAVWMRLLAGAPGSVLWLTEGSRAAAENLRAAAVRSGINPARVLFAPRLARLEDHLARLAVADLFLDTLPFNAHATASDALWAGLPVLTCMGGTFAGRVAASLLSALGVPELVTQDLQDYERTALRLANEPSTLAALRARVASPSPRRAAFDSSRYCRHLESAYRIVWQRAQAGESASALIVDCSAAAPSLTNV
jgi:predicted O-linked N-acetylglucosamine transferase (SPINDLY family)